jgi:large subunit ribosomal protein L28
MPDLDELAGLLGNFGDTAANLRLLIEQVCSPVGVTPFVGAGMSVPFKFQAWKDFLLEQARDNPQLHQKIEKRLAEGQYEEAAEDLWIERGENSFQTRLEDEFGPHRLAGRALSGAGITKRRFLPNLQRVKILLDGVRKTQRVCTDCIKSGRIVKV